ncbi:MAG: hypothetical protein NTY34_02840 [Candidatus Omnitrophica bacterium]|nr:hypothetical protein [Candidatus Omnitrophota bacterium]
MRVIEKRFTQGEPYNEKGDIYYKPAQRFVRFGTSGVRWLVNGASSLLAADKLKYYISNGYARNVGASVVLAEDFIWPNVGAVVKAIALYLLKIGQASRDRILITFDNRPGNLEYAVEAARILAAYGVKPVLSVSDKKFVPTPLPAGSRLVKDGGYAGHIMFTASHNGDEWNGIKFESRDGSAAGPDITGGIGAILLEELAVTDPQKAVTYKAAQGAVEELIAERVVETADVIGHYVKAVSEYLNINAIKKAIREDRVEFCYSAFFGSSGPAIIKLFESLGLPTDGIIETVKSKDEAYVASYEPKLEKLKNLGAVVRQRGEAAKMSARDTVVIGGAADNDADRFQVNEYNPETGQVDEYAPEKLAAILGHYLCRYKGFKGPFGRSFVTGSLQDEVAKLFGQGVIETATGFKFSPKVFVENGGVLFTEESYGLSFQGWTLDKDGILPSLLALELVAVTGKGLDEYYKDVLNELEGAGLRCKIYFKRYDMPLERGVKEEAIKRFSGFFNGIEPGETLFAGRPVSRRYDPKGFEGGMKFVLADESWVAMRSSGTEPLMRLYIEAGSDGERELLRMAALKLMALAPSPEMIARKLHRPLKAPSAEAAALFLRGGYNQPGYGISQGAAIDGSFAAGNEGDQGYFVRGGREVFLENVKRMRDFFERRAGRLKKNIRYVIKPGIGGQHTPFHGVADIFNLIDAGSGRIAGEYELGKDYEEAISAALASLGADWDEIAVIPSSKSGSTDETMMIFTEILHLLLKNIASREGLDGKLFADTVFNTMREVNFPNGVERKGGDLFKGFSIELAQKDLEANKVRVSYEEVRRIFGIVLGNMFFETTDRPSMSRLSAFIRNSELARELDPSDVPGFGAMFDNVGGRWTADLHMMTFLAFHKLDAEEYWKIRYEGVRQVREGAHPADLLAGKILDEGITDIALVVPDILFWFGKAMEQNFNESIWQSGFANLIAIKESMWSAQKKHYARRPVKLVINMSGADIPEDAFNVIDLEYADLEKAEREVVAGTFGELFTAFYGMTHNVGNALIARALFENGYSEKDLDIDDLDNPATKIFQRNLYLRQPYVELGKGLLERRLSQLQARGPEAVEEELKRITGSARQKQAESNIGELNMPGNIADKKELTEAVKSAIVYAKKRGRKLVPFIYLEGEKFITLRDRLISSGTEWVMQGTGDQHISYQQILAQPQNYMPFIISFVPEDTLSGRAAIGFAKGYLHNVSPVMVRDLFAEASYKALTDPRKNESGEAVLGAAGVFLRITDTDDNRDMLALSFESAIESLQHNPQKNGGQDDA